MAYDYNKLKKQYEWLNDEQKQQFQDMNKNDTSWNFQKFMDQYNAEQKWYQKYDISKAQDPVQQDYTPKQPENTDMTAEEYNRQNPKAMTLDEWNKSQNNVSPDLDQSKFWEAPWQITVQEWTAKDTWKPDYQISTDARLNEMKSNLDQYFSTSPRMFKDRETFNKMFQYNERESEAQKQLLDSYWKRKEDMDRASQYTSGESINNWIKNWQITTDQLNLIKEYDQEAYRKWQQIQEEEIQKRIVNWIVPPLMSDIATQIQEMINNLWIQAQDALDIEWIYNDTMERTWAYQTLQDANNTVKQIEAVNDKITSITSRYAASTWWTVSDALAAARMQKALAPYQQQMQGLQYQYQDYANLYSQKTATATQAANVRALQANENQRIWNQKCAALGFATSAMSYRTPEQTKQLELQYKQAENELSLLQKSRENDLALYNAYATTKLQNQLQNELTDLNVEDEQQLRANLNNILSDYYKNYWDIIQRSQAQVVDDIIAYAKKNWISVAQALTENFITPLQNKSEYKQKVASDYGMLSKQTIGTINWRSVIMTTNPNWSISYQYIDDNWTAIESTYKVWDTTYVKLYNGETMTAEEYNKKYWSTVWTIKPYDLVDEKVFDTTPASHSYYTLRDFIDDPKNKEWTYGGQCAKFVNDYLEKIWVGRYFWTEDIKERASRCNSDIAKVWTIAVFDYNNISSDWINHWHVWVVVDVDDKWYWVLESNFDKNNPEKIQKRYVLNGSSSCKGFFDPSKPPSATNTNSSLSSLDEAKKQNYLEEAKRWKMTPSKMEEIWDLAAEQGWDEEWREALKWWQNWDYSDTQLKRMDKADDTFKSNPDVKNFDEAKTQFQQLAVALNDTSWVWDMSAIFTFMKTLDPSSVVRESEFNSAAATAWVLNPQAILQSLERSVDWKFLTPKQREDFKKIAREFVRIKAEAYQQQYDFLTKRYEWAWLSLSDLPPNNAQILLDALWWWEATWPEDQITEIYSSAMNTNAQTWAWSYQSFGGYDGDWLHQMINQKM